MSRNYQPCFALHDGGHNETIMKLLGTDTKIFSFYASNERLSASMSLSSRAHARYHGVSMATHSIGDTSAAVHVAANMDSQAFLAVLATMAKVPNKREIYCITVKHVIWCKLPEQ